jgi:hypothetical protein
MANPGILGAISYEAESVFGETTTTTATLRLPITSAVDASGLVHNKVDASRVVQYRNACPGYILGTMGGNFKTKFYLTGHGSTTSGATTITALETLLGIVFGNAAVSAASGTTYTGTGTATAPATTASATFSAGSVCFNGAANDARGGGQAAAIGTHITTTLNLLTALGGAPSAADVLYSSTMIYPSESPTSTTIASVRMLLQTANLQYLCHGCFPKSLSITGLNPGELPTIEITWEVAWWEYRNSTFPSTTTGNTDNPAAVAGGSIFVNDVGTATRATRSTARGFTIDYSLGVETLRGFGGVNQYQDIVGCRRTPDKIMVSWSEDADAATTTPIIPGYGTSTTNKHILYTSGTTAGARLAIYLPNVVSSVVAIQKMDQNLNRVTFSGHADTGTTTTNDLTLSAFRMAFA